MKSQISVLALISIIVSLTQPAWSMEGQGDADEKGKKAHSSRRDSNTERLRRKRKEPPAGKLSEKHPLLKKTKTEEGVIYLNENNFPNAARCFKKAAKKGDAEAQHRLSVCYANGQGVDQDQGMAVHWLERAVAQGYVHSQFNLALYYSGFIDFLPRNSRKALELFKLAAQQGDQESSFLVAGMDPDIPKNEEAAKKLLASGFYNLFMCLERGTEIARDATRADGFADIAARLGHAEAQYAIGYRLMKGIGVPKNPEEAAFSRVPPQPPRRPEILPYPAAMDERPLPPISSWVPQKPVVGRRVIDQGQPPPPPPKPLRRNRDSLLDVPGTIIKLGDKAKKSGNNPLARVYYETALHYECRNDEALLKLEQLPAANEGQQQQSYPEAMNTFYILAKQAEGGKDLPTAKQYYGLAARFDHPEANNDVFRLGTIMVQKAFANKPTYTK